MVKMVPCAINKVFKTICIKTLSKIHAWLKRFLVLLTKYLKRSAVKHFLSKGMVKMGAWLLAAVCSPSQYTAAQLISSTPC